MCLFCCSVYISINFKRSDQNCVLFIDFGQFFFLLFRLYLSLSASFHFTKVIDRLPVKSMLFQLLASDFAIQRRRILSV